MKIIMPPTFNLSFSLLLWIGAASTASVQREKRQADVSKGRGQGHVQESAQTTAMTSSLAADMAKKPQYCVRGWSAWINRDTPNSGDGDHELMTSAEMASFCPGGTISDVDCQTVDGIDYFSFGEIVTCDLTGGLLCLNAENDPILCSDYKIRYECTCQQHIIG